MASVVESCVVCTEAIASTLGTCVHYVHRKCVLTSGKEECPLCKIPIGNVTRGERRVLNAAARSLASYNRVNAEQLVRDAMEEDGEDMDEDDEDTINLFEEVMSMLAEGQNPSISATRVRRPLSNQFQINALDTSSGLHQVMLQPMVAQAIFEDMDKPVYVNGLIPGMMVCFFPDAMRAPVTTVPSISVDLTTDEAVFIFENIEEEHED